MRVTKTFKGELFLFNVKIIDYKTKTCTVKPFHLNQEVNGVLSDDCKTISLSEPIKLSVFSTDELNVLKINKDVQKSFKDDFEFINKK